MRERDELGRPLCRLDRRDSRHAEHVAFRGRSCLDEGERGGLHRDGTGGAGDPGRLGLFSHIDHAGRTLFVEMRESHVSHPPSARTRAGIPGWTVNSPRGTAPGLRYHTAVRRLICLLAAALLASGAPAQPNVYRSIPPSERDDARPPASAPNLPPTPNLPPNLPDLGESAQAELTPQLERRIGESIMREIRRDPNYVDDPEV